MAQNRGSPFKPASPHSSSGGAESFKGTPETRLTAFSPDDGSMRPSKVTRGHPLSAVGADLQPVHFPMAPGQYGGSTGSGMGKDPFGAPTPGPGVVQQKLSPTANSFQPGTLTPQNARAINAISSGTPLVTPDRDAVKYVGAIPHALSTEMGISRYLLIASMSHVLATPEVEALLVVGDGDFNIILICLRSSRLTQTSEAGTDGTRSVRYGADSPVWTQDVPALRQHQRLVHGL